jgi:hypothetical protein
MRMAYGIAAVLLGFPGLSHAQEARVPEGWTAGADGPVHAESGTQCPALSDGFKPVELLASSDPNILGTCAYADNLGTGDAGVRVRRYAPGQGENSEAAGNDRALMEPRAGRASPLFTVRIEPLEVADGKRGARVVVTKTRNGLLIDCFGEDADFASATAKIAGVCGK